MKKVTKLLGLMTLTATISMGMAAFSTTAYAEEHAHDYVSGVCQCGALKIEAEACEISGVAQIASNALASNGQFIGDWDKSGANKIRIKVYASDDTTVTMGMCAAAFGGQLTSNASTNPGGELLLLWNEANKGTYINWAQDYRLDRGPAGTATEWHNYTYIQTESVQLTKGENVFIVEAYQGRGCNIDYFAFENVPEGITLSVTALEETDPPVDPPVEHTHSFVDNKCDCGLVRFEAENANDIVITSGASDWLKAPASASNGYSVGQFNGTNSKLGWKFDLDKEYTDVVITMYLSSCDKGNRTLGRDLVLKVNGEAVAFAQSTLPAIVGDAWHDYKPFASVAVTLGEHNVIEFINTTNVNVNIDCMDLEGLATAVISEYTEPEIPPVDPPVDPPVEHTHSFVDGRCECGAYFAEAETAIIEGTSSYGEGKDIFIRTGEDVAYLSGGACVAYFAVAGNSITWMFELDRTYENITLDFVMCYAVGSGNLNNIQIYVNGALVAWNTTSFHKTATDGPHAWYDMAHHYTEGVTLTEKTTIKLVNAEGCAMNTDCLIIELPVEAQISESNYAEYDNTAPEIGTISIDAIHAVAGDEIGFEFTVSDDKTAQEDIEVSVSVYLNYGAEEEKEISLINGKFVATEAGAYTVVVTAKDAAGNESTKIRRVLVSEKTEEDPKPDNPTPDDPTPDDPTPEKPSEEKGIIDRMKEILLGLADGDVNKLTLVGGSVALGLGIGLIAVFSAVGKAKSAKKVAKVAKAAKASKKDKKNK